MEMNKAYVVYIRKCTAKFIRSSRDFDYACFSTKEDAVRYAKALVYCYATRHGEIRDWPHRVDRVTRCVGIFEGETKSFGKKHFIDIHIYETFLDHFI